MAIMSAKGWMAAAAACAIGMLIKPTTPNAAAAIDMRANRVVVALMAYLLSGASWSGESSTNVPFMTGRFAT